MKDKLDLLVEIAWYGYQWESDNENSSYKSGSIDTVAHQIACCICQWYNIESGVSTCETRDYLSLDDVITKDELRKRLIFCISLLQEKNKAS